MESEEIHIQSLNEYESAMQKEESIDTRSHSPVLPGSACRRNDDRNQSSERHHQVLRIRPVRSEKWTGS